MAALGTIGTRRGRRNNWADPIEVRLSTVADANAATVSLRNLLEMFIITALSKPEVEDLLVESANFIPLPVACLVDGPRCQFLASGKVVEWMD